MIKVIELGAFSYTIDRGIVASIGEIPKDYRVKNVASSLDKVVVLVEPFCGRGSRVRVQSEPAPAMSASDPQASGVA